MKSNFLIDNKIYKDTSIMQAIQDFSEVASIEYENGNIKID